MQSRKSWIVIAALVCLATTAVAAVHEIPITKGENALVAVGQDAKELRFSVEVGGLTAMDVDTKAGVFTRLLLPGFHTSKIEGAPELPMMNRLVRVPAGAKASVVVDSIETRRVKLADIGVTNRIFPAQPSLSKSADPATIPFVIDEMSYAAKTARETVTVTSQGRLRAIDLSLVQVSPVQYLPATGEIEVAERIDFRVVFEGADSALQAEREAVTASPFFEPVYSRVTGAKGFHDGYPDRVADVVSMVIVTPPEFTAQLDDFVAWKTERGFQVIVAETGTAEVGTTTSSIQTYLHGLYNDATVENPAPSFVIFIGDVEQLPTFSESGDATDRPYCAVDGDLVPDMYYGRLSATSTAELQAILDKTMIYDQYTMADPSYLADVSLVAGVDASYAPTHGNGQINYGSTHYFNTAHGIDANIWLYPASGSASSALIQSVADGVAYVNYTAHGSQTAWADPSFTQSDINSLGNSGQYCLAVGNCCLTSTYDYSECFAETWLRAEDQGAIGYIGGSNSTYWDEDYWWGVGFHASSEIDGTAYPYEDTSLGAYDGLFHDHGEAETLHYVTNDAIVFCGNLAVMESGSTFTTYYWNIYNLMGDPSLSTYLGLPTANAVSTSGISATGLTVNADPGSYAGFTQDGVLLGAGTVDATGSLDVTFTTAPSGGSPVHMVVMAQNRVPYVEDLLLAAPAITLDVVSLSETLETDETTTAQITVSNTGEAGSVLVFDVGIQAEDPGVKSGVKSVAGSTMVVDDDGFLAGTTADLVFTVTNGSTDTEWLEGISLDFPVGVTVNSATSFTGGSAPMPSNGETGDGVTATWFGEDSSGWGVIKGGESASATVSVTFAAGLTGSVDVAWEVQGDVYGADPHTLGGSITFTSLGPSIALTAPDGGEILAIDSTVDITWVSAGGFTGPVMIELSRDGGGAWETIIASTDDDGSETWTVTGPASTDCLVRVGNPDGSVRDSGAAVFTIFQPVNWLAVSPVSGSIPDGSSQIVDVDFDATGMAEGTYTAFIVINHNVSATPEVLPVTLVVSDPTSGIGDVPAVFALEGNHPNPFNPMTNIAFSVKAAGPVRLQVLDLRGRIVCTLVDEYLEEGAHTATWDGRDSQGRAVASGLYVSRLQSDGSEASSKMTLAR